MLEETRWIVQDHESYGLATTARETLGQLPHKLRKTYIQFDDDEERTYGGVTGAKFALLATNLVLASRDKHRFLKCLKGLAAAFVEPLKAYLRVKLAMTTLDEIVDEAMNNAENGSQPLGVPDIGCANSGMTMLSCHLGRDPGSREVKSRLRYKSQNTDQFKDMNESLGYDVRDTSVYWIEKKAARLRRQWKAYGRQGLDKAPKPHEQRQSKTSETIIKDAVSVEPDYNTIWPPMKFPEPPPKASPSAPHSGPRDPGAEAGVTEKGEGMTLITRHSGLEPEPRENLVQVDQHPHDTVSGLCILQSELHEKTTTTEIVELRNKPSLSPHPETPLPET